MDPVRSLERVPCPACGGAGGGPFGPAGSAWDDEEWVCPRCKGVGMISLSDEEAGAPSQRPGLVKAAPDAVETPAEKKRKASA